MPISSKKAEERRDMRFRMQSPERVAEYDYDRHMKRLEYLRDSRPPFNAGAMLFLRSLGIDHWKLAGERVVGKTRVPQCLSNVGLDLGRYEDPPCSRQIPTYEKKIEGLTEWLRKTLLEREYMVLLYRFGIGFEANGQSHTYEETGKRFRVTRERIRQIEQKAFRKLRHSIAKEST